LKKIKSFLISFTLLYIVGCLSLYLLQDEILFVTNDVNPNYKFKFENKFDEVYIETKDNEAKLHCLHFKSEKPRGIVLFLHGNSGNNKSWAGLHRLYVNNNYDIIFVDYRDFGKSTGKIKSENQLVSDSQEVYDYIKNKFSESDIIISGTSIGSGIAAQLAHNNKPKMLILNAPYYSLSELVQSKLFIIPDFIIKYKFHTYKYLENLECPIEIFHGSNDKLIPIWNSIKLKKENKNIVLNECIGSEHNNFYNNHIYKTRMNAIFK